MKTEAANGFLRITGKFSKNKKLFIIIFSAAALLLIFGVLTGTNVIKLGSSNSGPQPREAKVTRGSIAITVKGSGPVESASSADIYPKVASTITKAYHKVGDIVKKGDILFELDDADQKAKLDQVNNNIAQARLTLDNNNKSLNDLTLKAPFSGQVSGIVPKEGEEVSKSMGIVTITDPSKLKMVVQFSGALKGKISTGQKVLLNVQDLMQQVDGYVSHIGNKPYTSASGGEVLDVEITVNNPGALSMGMKADAEISASFGKQASINTGTLEYIRHTTIKSEAGGRVKAIKVKENDFVQAGTDLIELSNDDITNQAAVNALKMKDLDQQLKNAQKQVDECRIYAPINGVVAAQDVKVGDDVKLGTAMATVTNTDQMEFSIPIDELDIAKIQTGQKVNISVDALTETSSRPLSGIVEKIAIEGTSSNGVTTYPVTIKIDDPRKLKIGMNANAEIMISEKQDTLLIPLEAVQKRRNMSFVMMKTSSKQDQGAKKGDPGSGWNGGQDGSKGGWNKGGQGSQGGQMDGGGNGGNRGNWNGSANQQGSGSNGQLGGQRSQGGFPGGSSSANAAMAKYYANAVRTPVELGINNDEYVEILDGLQEGDTVILPPLASSTSSQNNNQQMRIGGMGGFGGPPGGGSYGSGGNRSGGSGGGNSVRRND